jgi:hypothetical protein
MDWIENQLLKMQWLETLVSNFWAWLGVPMDSVYHTILTFFVYDVIKIILLLVTLIYIVSWIQTFFSPEKTRDLLRPTKGIVGNAFGALLGTITPFCSCSSIPLFIGFTKAGLPIGITFSFLISSPLVDLASVILLGSVFGWNVAFFYVVVGLMMAIVGGTLIEYFKMERYLAPFLLQRTPIHSSLLINKPTWKERHQASLLQVKDVLTRVFPYILLGVSLGALIHGVIPSMWIDLLLGANQWYAVPLATLLGVPMYADIFGTLPIAESLVAHGVDVGTILSFMMAVTALSLPSLILLKKVVQTKLIFFFTAYITSAIMLIGVLFNILF